MEVISKNDQVAIELNKDEALVLLDCLFKLNDLSSNSVIEDPITRQLLFDLEALLEENSTEVLAENYEQLVLDAKRRLGE